MQVLFGGDLGRYDRPILPDPAPVAECDILLLESTYGDRRHEPDDDGEQLARIVNETARRRGKVIVPAFAIGRVEEVVFWLKKLEAERRIPVLPVYLDSPMAAAAIKLYDRHDRTSSTRKSARTNGASAFSARPGSRVCSPHRAIRTSWSRASEPAIVIASSGMATGGRVLNHLKATLPDPRNTILFVGFQAAGTRGRQILEGAPRVKIHGAEIPIAAQTAIIHSMSAHADQGEILRWMEGSSDLPRAPFSCTASPRPGSPSRSHHPQTRLERIHPGTPGTGADKMNRTGMKGLVMTLALAAASSACGNTPEPSPAAVGEARPAAASDRTYLLERVDDAAVVQLTPMGSKRFRSAKKR